MTWLPGVIKSIVTEGIASSNIIFVDSGSTDGSFEYARDQGMRVIEYGNELFNYSRSLNLGIENTDCDYILIISAHCEIYKYGSISKMLENFKDEDVVGVYGRQIPTSNSEPEDIRDLLTVFGREKIEYTKEPFFHNAFSIIKKEFWNECRFDEDVNGIEDRIWAKKACINGKKIVYDPSGVVYHEHGLNHSLSKERAIRVCKALQIYHSDDYVEFPDFKK